MRALNKISTIALSLLLAAGPASAQIIDGETAAGFAGNVGQNAGFSDVTIGYVIAMLIRGFLGVLGLTFIILTVVAGFRWMNSGGNEETIKKSQDTIKNSIIGLVLVLAAWAITYFIFKVVPFSAPGGGTIGAE